MVKLGIRRDNNPELINITVTRGDIPMNSVGGIYADQDHRIYPGWHLRIQHLNEFISALKLKSQEQNLCDRLRGNSGGSLEVVVAMVNEFLHKAT